MIKLFIDFFPIILFFITYKYYDLLMATLVIVIACIIQMLLLKLFRFKIEAMHWVSLLFVVILGSITLLTKNASFIMYKLSFINLIFIIALIYGHFFCKRNFIEMMLGSKIKLEKSGWSMLNQMWIGFFVLTGLINYFFAKNAIEAKNQLMHATNTLEELSIKALQCDTLQSVAINLCYMAKQTEAYWVNFKLYGVLALTIIFVIFQALWLMKKLKS